MDTIIVDKFPSVRCLLSAGLSRRMLDFARTPVRTMLLNHDFIVTRFTVCSYVLLLLAVSQARAASGDAPDTLFSDHSLMTVQITAPFTSIMRDRSEKEYREGTFRYEDRWGGTHEFTVKIRTRGNFRRRKNVCDFAPLRLNFKKKELRDTEFDGQDKIKLVTHCENGSGIYQQYVLKEYLAYRMLQLLTDLSFRVRLLHVTYVDTDRRHSTRTRYAFLIEEQDQIAARIGRPLSVSETIDIEKLEPEQTNLVAVYEYFIGNTDFSAERGARDDACCHNVALFLDANKRLLPVPYDFDLAGIVNTPYAAPNPKYRIPNVTVRLYRGLCSNVSRLPETVRKFSEQRDQIRRLIEEQVGLSRLSRSTMLRYIADFYEETSNDAALEKNLIKTCS